MYYKLNKIGIILIIFRIRKCIIGLHIDRMKRDHIKSVIAFCILFLI